MTISATSTEKATEISTTSGMPLAPVAARMSPFSSDMKPTTIETAFRLHDHHQEAEQHDREREGEVLARQRVGFARDPQHHDLGQRDQSQAGEHRNPTPTTFSTSRRMPSSAMMRCNVTGMMTALKANAIIAVM